MLTKLLQVLISTLRNLNVKGSRFSYLRPLRHVRIKGGKTFTVNSCKKDEGAGKYLASIKANLPPPLNFLY